MKLKTFTQLTVTPILLAASINMVSLQAAEIPSKPELQTTWGLYVDSKEVAAMKQKLGDKMLFVDVRDPIEIMFTGFTDVVDINIPYMLADRSAWHKKKPVFNMELNKNFEPQLEAALKARGLSKDTPIAIMCRSGGTRGAPATKLLEGKGYKNIYVVTDGFEGGTVKEGKEKNWRLKNGWKNTGLPWSYKLNKNKLYLPTDTTEVLSKQSAEQKNAEYRVMLKHANPMPNYMSTIMSNAKALHVSDEQKSKLKIWIAAHKNKTAVVVKRIVQLEKGIAMDSMNGDDKEILIEKYQEMSDLRLKLASSKTDCRDNARAILSKEQWSKLVELKQAEILSEI